MPATTFQNGHDDAYFVTQVRRALRDQTPWVDQSIPADGTQGTVTPGSKPFRLQRPPVVRGSLALSGPGSPYKIVYDVPPAAGAPAQVECVTDTGELVFYAAPGAGNLLAMYQTSMFSDQQILDALQEGLRALYPDIWQYATDPPMNQLTSPTAIVLGASTFEYPLPPYLYDPRCIIIKVEANFPSGFTNWTELFDWDIVGVAAMKFGHLRTPGTVIRITYNARYEGLGDTEPDVMHLPVYYAISRLLTDQETERTKQGSVVALTGAGASAPGTAVKMADYWMQKFEQEKARFARSVPIRSSVAR